MINIKDSAHLKATGQPLEGMKGIEHQRSALKKNVMGKDDFLKLFLAQLKNQDPLQPRDSHELASQLAQFTSLEKLENIDKGIHHMGSSKNQNHDYKSLNLMGKKVSGDLSKIEYTGKELSLQYDLLGEAKTVEVSVINGEDEAERSWTFTDKEKGSHQLKWDGLKSDGSTLAHGHYKLKVKAYGGGGQEVEAKTSFDGIVTGINFTREGTFVLVGKKKVRLSDISKIMPAPLSTQSLNEVENVGVLSPKRKGMESL